MGIYTDMVCGECGIEFGVPEHFRRERLETKARPEDELADLFPGTGAVSKAWATWQGKFTLPPFQLTAAE